MTPISCTLTDHIRALLCSPIACACARACKTPKIEAIKGSQPLVCRHLSAALTIKHRKQKPLDTDLSFARFDQSKAETPSRLFAEACKLSAAEHSVSVYCTSYAAVTLHGGIRIEFPLHPSTAPTLAGN